MATYSDDLFTELRNTIRVRHYDIELWCDIFSPETLDNMYTSSRNTLYILITNLTTKGLLDKFQRDVLLHELEEYLKASVDND